MEMQLFVTNNCNLNCTYCYQKSKGLKRMDRETAYKAIDFYLGRLKEETNYVVMNFIGGEPLLEFELIKDSTQYLKEQLKDRGIKSKFSLTTNGTLLTQEIIKFLSENDFTIRLSFDGNAETQNRQRKFKNQCGSFDQVNLGLKLLQNSDLDFKVRMTITPANVRELTTNVSWFVEQGINEICLSVDFFADWNDHYQDMDQMLEELKELYLDSQKNNPVSLDIFDGRLIQFIIKGEAAYCHAGFNKFMIDTDGSIYPCSYVVDNPTFCYGHIDTGVDFQKRDQTLKDHLLKHDQCNDCELDFFCHGRKCGYLNCQTTGYFSLPATTLCHHERLIYRLMTEIIQKLYQMNDKRLHSFIQKIEQHPRFQLRQEVKDMLQGDCANG